MNKGYKDASGAFLLAWTKAGGYYFGAFLCSSKDTLVSSPRFIFRDGGKPVDY